MNQLPERKIAALPLADAFRAAICGSGGVAFRDLPLQAKARWSPTRLACRAYFEFEIGRVISKKDYLEEWLRKTENSRIIAKDSR
jgi:hypothetical protein